MAVWLALIILLACSVLLINGDLNYYAVLGVPESADEATIGKAYRRGTMLAASQQESRDSSLNQRQLHLLSEAYTTLSDRQKREQYDLARKLSSDSQEQPGVLSGDPASSASSHHAWGINLDNLTVYSARLKQWAVYVKRHCSAEPEKLLLLLATCTVLLCGLINHHLPKRRLPAASQSKPSLNMPPNSIVEHTSPVDPVNQIPRPASPMPHSFPPGELLYEPVCEDRQRGTAAHELPLDTAHPSTLLTGLSSPEGTLKSLPEAIAARNAAFTAIQRSSEGAAGDLLRLRPPTFSKLFPDESLEGEELVFAPHLASQAESFAHQPVFDSTLNASEPQTFFPYPSLEGDISAEALAFILSDPLPTQMSSGGMSDALGCTEQEEEAMETADGAPLDLTGGHPSQSMMYRLPGEMDAYAQSMQQDAQAMESSEFSSTCYTEDSLREVLGLLRTYSIDKIAEEPSSPRDGDALAVEGVENPPRRAEDESAVDAEDLVVDSVGKKRTLQELDGEHLDGYADGMRRLAN